MATHLSGDYVIRTCEVRVELVAEDVRFVLTLINSGGVWRYNASLTSEETRSQSVASGRVIEDDHVSAVRRADGLPAGLLPHRDRTQPEAGP